MSGLTDPLADMLTRIRNASGARHATVSVPNSKLRLAVARILKEQGFVGDVVTVPAKPAQQLRITLRYDERRAPMMRGLQRVSTPGRRVYVGKDDVPRVQGGLGVAIVSTSKGVMTGQEAHATGVGGEILCRVW
ncbi:MAG: 30S ribosomal protein S8 [SAR202 cluster bacterium]|nr:30S ribosomal protein S8 [SAR202 cluster bacterium]